MKQRSFFWHWTFLFVLLLLGFFLSICLGSVPIPFKQVIVVLSGQSPGQSAWDEIIINYRLSKSFTALLAGAALSLAGLQLQTLFRNPLAEPYVLGISAGAGLGVAFFVLGAAVVDLELDRYQWLYDAGIALPALSGAVAVLILILWLSHFIRQDATLLVIGLMVGYAAGALINLLTFFSEAERIQSFLLWTFGSFGGTSWQQLPVFAGLVLLGLGLTFFHAKSLNALQMGEIYARSLGVEVKRVRNILIVSAALLSAAVTAFCGPIAFIGFAVPHLCRSFFRTADHRQLIPAVLVCGSAVALFADIVAQLPGNAKILPLNSITALLGAPLIIWVLLKKKYHA